MKKKTCKNSKCKQKFTPERQMQGVCSFECSLEYAKQLREKREAKKKTDARISLREFKKTSKVDLKVTAQRLINQYARKRDEKENGYSCKIMGCNIMKETTTVYIDIAKIIREGRKEL
jgi:hypothetical protein